MKNFNLPSPFLVSDDLLVTLANDGSHLPTQTFQIRTRENILFILDQGYVSAIEYAMHVTRNSAGGYRMFPSSNKGGDGSENFRLIVNGNAELSLFLARIILDAKPGEIVKRRAGRNDYSVANLVRTKGFSEHDTRASFIAIVKELSGDAAGNKLKEKLYVADALHRPSDNSLEFEPEIDH